MSDSMSHPATAKNPAEKLLLGIDTSGSEGSLALAAVSAQREMRMLTQTVLTGRHYSDELIAKLRELLAHSGVLLGSLEAVVVVQGPGSFTGLRAGLSAAKALAEALALPIIAVSNLALLASCGGPACAAVLDAGRGEFYVRLPNFAESLETLASLIEKAGGARLCICEPHIAERLSPLDVLLVPAPTARDALHFALPRLLAESYDDIASLDANYVRRPYAAPLPLRAS